MADEQHDSKQDATALAADVFPLRREWAQLLAQALPIAVFPNLTAQTVGQIMAVQQQLALWLRQDGDTHE